MLRPVKLDNAFKFRGSSMFRPQLNSITDDFKAQEMNQECTNHGDEEKFFRGHLFNVIGALMSKSVNVQHP